MTTQRRIGMIAALAAMAVMSSWPAVLNGFTYDARPIILENASVHGLAHWWRLFGASYWPAPLGGDGYRPLTMLFFALQWMIGRGSPLVFQVVSVALYASTAIAVFSLAETCLPPLASWLVAALFAVHPVHVEAVASIVGQSEALVALCVITATTLYVRRRNSDTLHAPTIVAIAALYLAACFFKEHGLVLPLVLLAAESTIVISDRPVRSRLVTLRPLALAMVLVALLYIAVHAFAQPDVLTGFHQYVPFKSLRIGAAGRVFTMFGLVPQWVRLLLWPARLTPEYGPPAFPIADGFQLYQLPGIVIVAAVIALGVVARKKHPTVAFGVFFMAAALLPTSNFIVPSGLLLSERTLFLPSVGMLIVLGAGVAWLAPWPRTARLGAILAAPLLVLGIWRSATRTRDWKNNDVLFNRAVAAAPLVYRTHYMLGAWDIQQNRLAKGEREYLTAIALFDQDPGVFFTLGEQYMRAGMFKPAIDMFHRALAVDSTKVEARVRLALALAELGHWREANAEALIALRQNTRAAPAMLSILRWASAASKHPGAFDAGLAGIAFDSSGHASRSSPAVPAPSVRPPS